MRPSLKRLLHYRPRCLTLLVFATVAAMLVLANLSDVVRMRRMPYPPPKSEAEFLASLIFDTREPPDDDPFFDGPFSLSYGWPLLWRQYVVRSVFQVGAASFVYGELRSTGRLAANVPMWLNLVPKLLFGNVNLETPFPVWNSRHDSHWLPHRRRRPLAVRRGRAVGGKQSFSAGVPKQSLGTR